MHSSVRNLLTGLIDYAGLFPPASLDIGTAIRNFARYRESELAWILGRFIVPASRLGELDGLPGPLSILAGNDLDQDLRRVREFLHRHPGSIDTVEMRVNTAESIHEAALRMPSEFTVYFEIPAGTSPATLITAIAEEGARAKIRTGGLTAEAFPSTVDLVRFLELCSIAGAAFKATAGLHHPISGEHALTYEQQSPCAAMHGFLNVFLAAGFVRQHMPSQLVGELIEERCADAFQFSEEEVRWRDQRLSGEEIATTRRDFAITFGSCSFEDPISDLRAMGLL